MQGARGERVYVGLGSNLGDRLATLRGAVAALREVAGTVVVGCSPVFETRPLGPSELAYLNAAVELETSRTPAGLLAELQAVERAHGRTRRTRWAARTLDLDLLVWPGVVSDAADLKLPHPELVRRDFVLAPLAALAPGLRPYGGATVAETLAALSAEDRTILRQLAELLC